MTPTKRWFSLALILTSAASAGTLPMHAQDTSADSSPKVLYIIREFLKPGRDGAPHEKTEAAFAETARASKVGPRYIAFTSMTGASRALFFSGYPSMAAVEAEHKAMTPATLSAMDRAMVSDGDLLTQLDQSMWVRRDDLSQNTRNLPSGARYLIIRQFIVKPGHIREWNEFAELVKAAFAKGVPEAHWTMYQSAFGNTPVGTFLVMTALKSLTEVDQMEASDPRFVEALGESGLKRLAQLQSDCVETRVDNLFAISPKMSVPPDEILNAEPAYWRPKPNATGAAKKVAVATKPTD